MIKPLNQKDSYSILENNYIGHLAYIYNNKPFIAPITYFYNKKDNTVIGYSNEGHKVTAMRKHIEVAMEVSEIDSVNQWKSIVVHGVYKEIHGSEAKAYLHDFSLGVKDLITRKEHRNLDFINQFSSKIDNENPPIVFLIKIGEITGKMRNNG